MKKTIKFFIIISLLRKIKSIDYAYLKSIKSNDFLDIYSDFQKTNEDINNYYTDLYFYIFPVPITSSQTHVNLVEFISKDLSMYKNENPKETFLSQIENSFKKNSSFENEFLEESMIHSFLSDLEKIHQNYFLGVLEKKLENKNTEFKHDEEKTISLIKELLLELKKNYYKEKPVLYENFSNELLARVNLLCTNENKLFLKIKNYYELRKYFSERILYEIKSLVSSITFLKDDKMNTVLNRIEFLITVEISFNSDKISMNSFLNYIYDDIEKTRKTFNDLDSKTDYWFIKTIKIILERKNSYLDEKHGFLKELDFFKNNIERDCSDFFSLFITNFSDILNKDIFNSFFSKSYEQKMVLYMYEVDMMLYLKKKNANIFDNNFYDHLLKNFKELFFL